MEIIPLVSSFHLHKIPFKAQPTLHYLVKLSLFSWQPFCKFHVRQMKSEGKNKCSLSAFFFFFWTGFLILDWNHLCGKTAQRTQTSEEGEHKNHKRNPQELWEGAAWGNTHLHKLHYAWSYWGSFWWLIGDLFTWVLLQALTTFWVRQSGVWC